jgi:cell division protein FtsL
VEDVLAVAGFFTTVIVAFVVFGPIGRAIAAKITRNSLNAPGGEVAGQLEAMEERMEGLTQQVSELAERQDFTERLLAQAREKGLLGSGGPA